MIDMALVVFSEADPLDDDATWRDRWAARVLSRLKPGFRHCFVMWRAENFPGWIVINNHAARYEAIEQPDREPIYPLPDDKDFYLPHYGAFVDWMEESGLAHSVWASRQPSKHYLIHGPLTCVNTAKHALGIEAPLVQTPWQLYRYLKAEESET